MAASILFLATKLDSYILNGADEQRRWNDLAKKRMIGDGDGEDERDGRDAQPKTSP